MKKRIMVYLNENQVEAIEKNNDEFQPYSKFIMECYLTKRKFIVSNKVSKKAVNRNRLKRIIRDFFQDNIENIQKNID